MRIRTLALGLALCCGLTGMAQAAAKKQSAVKSQKSTVKKLKKRNAKRGKGQASSVKPRKAKKTKIAKR